MTPISLEQIQSLRAVAKCEQGAFFLSKNARKSNNFHDRNSEFAIAEPRRKGRGFERMNRVVNVRMTAGAKARRFFSASCGTTKVVP
jgi:hypothetical protein